MLLVYSAHITTRLNYIISALFGTDAEVTNDTTKFKASTNAKINYSNTAAFEDALTIKPHGLLEEDAVKQQPIHCFEWNGLKAFFATAGDIPFDLFAAAFYLVTRYEEYLPYEPDAYGRYAHINSLAFKENFIHLPLVNLWVREMKEILLKRFPSFTIHHSPFNYTPTYDVDIAYSYKGKGFLRNMAGLYKDLVAARLNEVYERFNVITGGEEDPFDSFKWLDELHQRYNLKPIYFFLLAEKNKHYDKNISPYTNVMQQLLQKLTSFYKTGIHPSWQSGDDENTLRKEIALLAAVKKENVLLSRQHYIRMTLPATYRLLIDSGIQEDYSMGYGSINGFRASICTPFYWYDLTKEEITPLLLRPFCYMEANSFFEQHYSADQAVVEIRQYHDIVKSVQGELITIFHNHFLTKQKQWAEWRRMYEAFMRDVL